MSASETMSSALQLPWTHGLASHGLSRGHAPALFMPASAGRLSSAAAGALRFTKSITLSRVTAAAIATVRAGRPAMVTRGLIATCGGA